VLTGGGGGGQARRGGAGGMLTGAHERRRGGGEDRRGLDLGVRVKVGVREHGREGGKVAVSTGGALHPFLGAMGAPGWGGQGGND
jgi:hypothetical protein